MNFGEAIQNLKAGKRVARKGWNGKGMWLELQVPDAHSKMSLPYIYLKTADNNLVPWLASQTDMLAEDWEAIEKTEEAVTLTLDGKEIETFLVKTFDLKNEAGTIL